MTTQATFVRDLTGWRGDVKLYRLDPPYAYADAYPEPLTVTHVAVSAASVPYSGPETYVFAADEQGEVVDWCELPGSFRGGLDHQRALDGFLAEAVAE